MQVNLKKMPSAPKEYGVRLGALNGGLNTSRVPSEIKSNQLSDSLNVLWRDGMLRSRNGKVAVTHTLQESEEPWHLHGQTPDGMVCLNMYDRPWNDHLFMAFCESDDDAGYIAAYDLQTKRYKTVYTIAASGSEQLNLKWGLGKRGSFFAFGEHLYYKNNKLFLQISFNETGRVITAAAVNPYVPIVMINTTSEGVGDLYQPENRLSPKKEIWYNGNSGVEYVELPCDGETTVFYLPYKSIASPHYAEGFLRSVDEVYIGAALGTADTDYTVDLAAAKITTASAPPLGAKLSVKVTLQRFTYKLPFDVDSIESVKVKNLSTGEYVTYSATSHAHPLAGEYLYSNGKLIFNSAENTAPNNVDANVLSSYIKVVYSKANNDAFKSIDECYIANTFGATGIETNCIVMAGASAQPNAVFWSGNDETGANPAYFPMTNYNIVGSANEPITAFGRQQNRLVILQTDRVSAAEYTFTTVDERLYVSLNIRQINDRIGCDLPLSVQLIENNLVWAHTRYGVMYLKDSTYAYETLVACISGNVNEVNKVDGSNGLLADLVGGSANPLEREVCSADDGSRYWLCCGNGKVYVWDYSLQPYTADTQRLSWWKLGGVYAAAWALDGEKLYGLLPHYLYTGTDPTQEEDVSDCWLFEFNNGFLDFGTPFSKYFQLPTQTFGTYDRLKNVERMVVAVDSEVHSYAKIIYLTDYEDRRDQTDLETTVSSVTNPIRRPNYVRPNAIHVRKPKCLHVHTFAVRFESEQQYDLNMLTCQLYYKYVARTKAGLRI